MDKNAKLLKIIDPTIKKKNVPWIEMDGIKVLRRTSRTIPYGFVLYKEKYLKPDPLEQAALKRALYYLSKGSSYRATAAWLSTVARPITHMGLKWAIKRGF